MSQCTNASNQSHLFDPEGAPSLRLPRQVTHAFVSGDELPMQLEDSFEIREETAQRLIGHRGGCRLDILLGHVRLYIASKRLLRTYLQELEIPYVLLLGVD
jgi:hypothetical protein